MGNISNIIHPGAAGFFILCTTMSYPHLSHLGMIEILKVTDFPCCKHRFEVAPHSLLVGNVELCEYKKYLQFTGNNEKCLPPNSLSYPVFTSNFIMSPPFSRRIKKGRPPPLGKNRQISQNYKITPEMWFPYDKTYYYSGEGWENGSYHPHTHTQAWLDS